MEHHLILRVTAKLLLPPIFLFALYVQFHGDFGPGGGFQAGVIFAAGFILYGLIFGVKTAREVVSGIFVQRCAALGVLIYAGVGVAGLVLGGNFLDFRVLSSDPLQGPSGDLSDRTGCRGDGGNDDDQFLLRVYRR